MDAADLERVDVSKRAGWIWTNWLPEMGPTTIYGDGGKGKSLILLRIMRSVISGESLPDGSKPGVTGNCLIISGEDSKEEIRARVDALGGPSGKYGKILILTDEDTEDFMVPKKWTELQSLIKKRQIVLWAIDPIMNFIESKVRSINDASVREHIFKPMNRIMERTKSTGVIVTHMNKDSKGQLTSRATGSGAFVNAVRSSIAITDSPAGGFLMGVPKTNRAKMPNPIGYHLYTNEKHRVVTIDFDGEQPEQLSIFSPTVARDNHTQLGRAQKMFHELLAGGPISSKKLRDIIAGATSTDTYNKAKKLVGAESYKVGLYWMTKLPTEDKKVEPVNTAQQKTLKKLKTIKKPVTNVEEVKTQPKQYKSLEPARARVNERNHIKLLFMKPDPYDEATEFVISD